VTSKFVVCVTLGWLQPAQSVASPVEEETVPVSVNFPPIRP
jgi:hypothetical protein